MSESAIFDATQALRTRIGEAVGSTNDVYVGPPLHTEIQQSKVSLFLFHLEVNSEMRNQVHLDKPPAVGAATQPVSHRDVLPLDLRFLVTVFRSPDPLSSTPNELITLGKVIRELQAEPNLFGGQTSGQIVRLTLEPYPTEEISRIWGLFPQDVYRTSIVYLASPVIIDSGKEGDSNPVIHREQHTGALYREQDEDTLEDIV